jgi:hypothetical protein
MFTRSPPLNFFDIMFFFAPPKIEVESTKSSSFQVSFGAKGLSVCSAPFFFPPSAHCVARAVP